MHNLQPFFYGLGAGLVIYFTLRIMISFFFYIGKPNEVLIFSGRSHKLPNGKMRGYRYIIGGWAFRFPILEEIARMDLTEMPILVTVNNAYAKGQIMINISAVANVKVSSEPNILDAAIEHFLGQPRSQIAKVAKETLEGHLRGVIAELTPEAINEDRLTFAEKVEAEVTPDFDKLGLHLDNFKIQNINDTEKYLISIGQLQIEEQKKHAAIAQSNANKVARNTETEAKGLAKATNEEVEMVIRKRKNELDTFINNELAKVAKEEETTKLSAAQARAEAEQELQKIRSLLEEKRRNVEEILPAKIQRKASEILAVGEAAYIQKRGEATAKVLALINEVWKEAGPIAKDIYILDQIENIISQVVDSVNNVQMKEVNLLDSGDGKTLINHIQSYPAMVTAVLNELKSITGVDVARVLNPTPSNPGAKPSGFGKLGK
jgi:flotillin